MVSLAAQLLSSVIRVHHKRQDSVLGWQLVWKRGWFVL